MSSSRVSALGLVTEAIVRDVGAVRRSVGNEVGGREEMALWLERTEEEAVEKGAEEALGRRYLRLVGFEENETNREKLAVFMGIYRFLVTVGGEGQWIGKIGEEGV